MWFEWMAEFEESEREEMKKIKTIAKYTTNILGIIGAIITGINIGSIKRGSIISLVFVRTLIIENNVPVTEYP